MGYGRIYSMPMSAVVSTCSVYVQESFDVVCLLVATMPSVANLDLYASVDGSNYYQVRKPPCSTTTVQIWSFTVAATCAANGSIVPIQPGFKYYKLVADSTPTTTIGFQLICGTTR